MAKLLLLSSSVLLLLLLPPCEYPPNQIGGRHNGHPGKPGCCRDTKDQSEWQNGLSNCICGGKPFNWSGSFNAICIAKADVLNNNPGPSFTPSPPPIPLSLALFTQPSLLPEVVPKLLDPITNPLPFTDEWGHPFRVVKCRSQSKEGDNGGQLMKEQKCRYVSQGCIDQRFGVVL